MFRKTLSFVMMLLIFNMPLLTFSQQTDDAVQAIADAQRDAKLADTQIWALVGCTLMLTGILVAYLVPPTVPTMNLLGKSPEYVAYYTSTYQEKVKNERTKQASLGCLGTGVVWTAFYTFVIFESIDNYAY